MNTNGEIFSGTVFPITENGVALMYVTDAPFEVITESYRLSDTAKEFVEEVKLEGYNINRYKPTVQINFDL